MISSKEQVKEINKFFLKKYKSLSMEKLWDFFCFKKGMAFMPALDTADSEPLIL